MIDGIEVFDGNTTVGPNLCGVVYCWTENGIPCYVGITKNSIFERIQSHLRSKRDCYLFQNKLRARVSSFRCYIVFWSNMYSRLKAVEVVSIKTYNTFKDDNPDFGYNLTRGGDGASGYVHPPEVIAKITAKNRSKGYYWTKNKSQEAKRKLSQAMTGKQRKPFSLEHRRNMAKAQTGRIRTPPTAEQKRQTSLTLKEYYRNNPEHRLQINKASGLARLGKKRGPYKKVSIGKAPVSGSNIQ